MEAVVERFAASIAESLITSLDLRRVLSLASEQLGIALEADRVVVLLYPQPGQHESLLPSAMEWSRGVSNPEHDREILSVSRSIRQLIVSASQPLNVQDTLSSPLLEPVQRSIRLLNISRIMASPARANGLPQAAIILYRSEGAPAWSPEESDFVNYVSRYLGIAVANCLSAGYLPRRLETTQRHEPRSGYGISFNISGRVSAVSPLFEQIAGVKEAQLKDWSLAQFVRAYFTAPDVSVLENAYRSVRAKNAVSRTLLVGLRHSQGEEATRAAVQFVSSEESGAIELLLLTLPPELQRTEVTEDNTSFRESWYRRLVENADAILFFVDKDHVIQFMSERSTEFFGIPAPDFSAGTPVQWYDLAHLDDREQLRRTALDAQAGKILFEEEFRIVNHLSGRERWLLAKFVPVEDHTGAFQGWDGFAVDITARKEAQEALDAQSKKVRALYTVSSAIRGYLDPSNIASRGLAALCEATGADAGICYLYASKDADRLSLVAHHGFSAAFSSKVESYSSLPSLSTYVAQHGQSVVVPDIRTDPRASLVLSEEEGVRSALLVPISVEEETLGTLALFHRQISKFDGGDVMLVAAAANQIGLASRQANLFTAYRRQTKNLSALYRLSHELSGFLTLDDIFQRAFAIISDELGLERLWLGLVNETGTRIVGTAAYGPGWKKKLIEMNVEISGRDHPISQVVTTRKGMVIGDADSALSRFGVKRLFSRLDLNVVGLVPLVSGGQVLGVLAFQVSGPEAELDDEQMTLISSLGSEIAAIVHSKRLEERIAQGDKMRAAGLLAAGIAHNFNNLLQAILGQASLLEMQFPDDERVGKPAKTINQAATKGAALVKQLVSFANLEEPSGELSDINAIIEHCTAGLARHLRDDQSMDLKLDASLPRAFVDSGQLVRILHTLVSNAADAMDEGGRVEIFSDQVTVNRDSPHYEVPYGRYVRIGVRDNGIGMDAETKKRCFEPFFTTKDRDPNSGLSLTGAGLSLAAAYALARKNGGRLVVDSRPGHGSLFTLYLPVPELGSEAGVSTMSDLESDFLSEPPLSRRIEKQSDTGEPAEGGMRKKTAEQLRPIIKRKNGSFEQPKK